MGEFQEPNDLVRLVTLPETPEKSAACTFDLVLLGGELIGRYSCPYLREDPMMPNQPGDTRALSIAGTIRCTLEE